MRISVKNPIVKLPGSPYEDGEVDPDDLSRRYPRVGQHST
jgi:hypothetical protein